MAERGTPPNLIEDNLIEDQEQGLVQGATPPDYSQIAKDLKQRGIALGQLQSAGEALPVNRTAMANLEQEFTSLFADEQEFSGALDAFDPVRSVNENTAYEAGTIKAMLNDTPPEYLKAEIEDEVTKTLSAGYVELEDIVQGNTDLAKQTFGMLPGEADEQLRSIKEEIDTQKSKPEILTLYEELAEDLRSKGVSEKAIPYLTAGTELWKRRHLNDVLAFGASEQFKEAGVPELILDFGELFTDVFGGSERVQRREIVADVLEDPELGTEYKVWRSDDIRELMEDFETWEFDQQREYLLKVLEASEEAETILGNNNTLLSTAMISELRDALMQRYGGDDWVTYLDAAGLASLAPVARGMKSFATALTTKVMKMRDAYLGIDVTQDFSGLDKAIEDFVSLYSPEQDTENVLNVFKESKNVKIGDAEGVFTSVRMGNSRMGNVTNSIAPRTLQGLLRVSKQEGTFQDTLKSMGYDPETVVTGSTLRPAGEVQEGINPRVLLQESTVKPNNEIIGTTTAVELMQARPLAAVLNSDEIVASNQRRFSRIEEITGNSMKLHADRTEIIHTDSGVEYTGIFGKSDTEGFSSFDEASLAAKNIVGEDYEVVVKSPKGDQYFPATGDSGIPTEYFLRVRTERMFTPTDGQSFLDDSTWFSPNTLTKFLTTSSDRLGRDIIEDFSLLKDFNLAVANRLQRDLKTYTRLGKGDRSAVNSLLEVGDARQMEWTPEAASEFLGRNVSEGSKVWKGYRAVRDFYDESHDILNMRVRADMEKRGFKDIQIRDEFGNKVYGKPVTFDELRNSGNKTVYDVDNNKVRVIDEVEDSEEYVPIQLNRTQDFDGNAHTVVLRKRGNVKTLPQQVVPRRKGYVNLAYQQQGARIQLRAPRVVNGVTRSDGHTEVLKFARTEKSAEEWLNEVPEGGTKSNRDLLLEDAPDGAKLVVTPTRENLFELTDVDIKGDGSAVPFNLRGRSDSPVETTGGTVEILEMEDRISTALNSVERSLNKDALNILKSRFRTQYSKYLNTEGRFPDTPDLESFWKKDSAGAPVASKEVRKNISNVHNYILDMERMQGFRQDSWVQKQLDRILENVLNLPAGKIDTLQTAKGVATFMVIWGRPLYQALANTSQVLLLAQRDPVRGTASIVEAALTMPLIGLRKLGKSIDYDLVAKFVGFKNGKELQDWVDLIETSGVFSASQVDNLLSNYDRARKVASRGTFRKLGTVPTGALKEIQALGTNLSNIAAYRHAMKLVQEKNPALNLRSGRGQRELHKMFRDLTLRMDKADVLETEVSPLGSIVFLWTQHVYKGWKETILKPGVRTLEPAAKLLNKTPGVSKIPGVRRIPEKFSLSKEESVWADSLLQAYITTAMNLGMFGGAGLVGTQILLDLDEEARKQGIIDENEELSQYVYEGVLDQMLKYGAGIDVNLPERISFGDAPTMLLSISGLDEYSLDIFGGVGIGAARIIKFRESMKVLTHAPIATEQDTKDLIEFIASEAAGIFAGWGDYEKYRLQKNLGLYFSSSGQPLYKADPSQAVASLFSFRDDDAALRERILFDKKGSGEEKNFYTDKMPKVFAKWFWQEVDQLASAGKLNFDTFEEQKLRFTRMLSAAVGDAGASTLAVHARRSFHRMTINPEGVFKDAEMNAKNRALVERVYDNYSYKEARAKLSQLASLAKDENLRQYASQYLEMLDQTNAMYAEEQQKEK